MPAVATNCHLHAKCPLPVAIGVVSNFVLALLLTTPRAVVARRS